MNIMDTTDTTDTTDTMNTTDNMYFTIEPSPLDEIQVSF